MEQPGELLGGKYRLVRLLGQGGMGAVYEAVQENLRKRVAVKLLLPKYASNEGALNRLVVEARAAAAIGHPCIIDVYDMGFAAGGAPFLVMEYLPGQSLRQHLDQQGTVEVSFAAYVACQILSGLAAAHQRGIIHRDLKPDNVFLVDTGRDLPDVRLLDFGISKVLAAELRAAGTTTTGAILGTPCYMSPEQARGERKIDHRVDLYATGVILYQCLTGQVPRVGPVHCPGSPTELGQLSTDAMAATAATGQVVKESVQPGGIPIFRPLLLNEVIAALLTKEVIPPRRLGAPIDGTLENLLLQALQSDREQRLSTAQDFLRPLLPYVEPRLSSQLFLPPDVQLPEPASSWPSSCTSNSDKHSLAPTLSPADQRPPWRAAGPLALIGGALVMAVGLWWAVPRQEAAVAPTRPAVPAVASSPERPGPPLSKAGAPPVGSPEPRPVQSLPEETEAAPAKKRAILTLRLSATPAEAEIFVDDAKLPGGGNPFEGKFARDGLVHRVRARASGHHEWQQAVVFDRDQEIRIELRPKEARGTPVRRRGAAATRPAGSPAAADPWGRGQAPPAPPPPSRRRWETDPWAD